MQPALITSLRLHFPQIVARWHRLLGARLQPALTPQPAVLAFMVEWTCEAVLAELAQPSRGVVTDAQRECRARHCERSPFPRYYAAGEIAFQQAVIASINAAAARGNPVSAGRVLEEVAQAFRVVRNRDVESFCRVCPLSRTQRADAAIAA